MNERWSRPSSLSDEDIVDLQPPDKGIESLRSDSDLIIAWCPCWRLTLLGCSPYIFNSHWIEIVTTISNKARRNDGLTSVSLLLASYHLTPWPCISGATSNTHSPTMKHKYQQEPNIHPYPRWPTLPPEGGINTTLGHHTSTSDMNQLNAKEGRPRNRK